MKNKTPWVATALVLCVPYLAQAQTAPADTKSPSTAPQYESAFTDYKPWKDISAGDWRAANEAVGAGAAGAAGHTGHTMSMPPAASSQSGNPRPAPSASPPTAPHEGHQMQMPGGQK